MVLCFVHGCMFCMFLFNLVNYVFLLLCMFCSVYFVSLYCSVYCVCVCVCANVYSTTATGCKPNCSQQIYHIFFYNKKSNIRITKH